MEKVIRDFIRKIRYYYYKIGLKSCGRNVTFASQVSIQVAKNISIGNNVRIGAKSTLSGQGGIIIGDNVSIGEQLLIWSANHNYYNPKALPYDAKNIKKIVVIEDNVWIGARVSIIPGVKIGEGAVVGLGSVVTKDVPSCAVVAGNPASIIKYRNKEVYKNLKVQQKFKNV